MKLEEKVRKCEKSRTKKEVCSLLYWHSEVKCKYQGEKYQQEIVKQTPFGLIGGYRPTYKCKK
jgi:hypothetical protein